MNDFDVLDVKFTFISRPRDLPGDLRPNWRVPLLVLMLDICCRGGRSSLYKLHLLNWMIRKDDQREVLLSNLSEDPDYSQILIQVEPSFIRAIQFAVAEKLVERLDKSRVKITERGKQFAHDIATSNSLISEKSFLKDVGLRLTEAWVEGFAAWSRAA
jgi:hypothetical protein